MPRLLKRLGVNYVRSGYCYQAETKTLLAALSGTYSPPRKKAIDQMIKSLKTAGVWSKLDVLQMYAAPTAADAVVNWRAPGTFNATLVNSPTLEVDRGITGDGLSSYINTGFTPSTASGNFTQNSAFWGVYIRNNKINRSFGTRIGANEFVILEFRNTANEVYARINDTTQSRGNSTTVTSAGFLAASRTSSSAKSIYKNGLSLGDFTVNSTGLLSAPILVSAYNSNGSLNYSDLQSSVNVIGGGLNATEQLALFTALETYLDTIGAGVIS